MIKYKKVIMKAKILTIIIISILLCSCTELPNLNFEAASKSLSQTSENLTMAYMAEKGLFPYWLYMNPYYFGSTNFLIYDDLLHQIDSLLMSPEYLEYQSSRYSTPLSDADYDELVNTIVSLLMRAEEEKKEAAKKKLESSLYPCPDFSTKKEEKKELKPFSDYFKKEPKEEKKISLPPFPELFPKKEEKKEELKPGFPPCPELFPKKEEKKEELKSNFPSFSDLFKEESKAPSYKTAMIVNNFDNGERISIKLPNNLILKLRKIQSSGFPAPKGTFVQIVINNCSMIWLCDGTRICRFILDY